MYSKKLVEVNNTMIIQHMQLLEKLYSKVRIAVDRRSTISLEGQRKGHATQVIVVTSGATFHSTAIDECILRFNRYATTLAHKYGFAVLHRGEIERRFMYLSKYAEAEIENGDGFLKTAMHLDMPVQVVVATTLFNLITCLDSESVGLLGVKKYIDFSGGKRGGNNAPPPLHSAPAP